MLSNDNRLFQLRQQLQERTLIPLYRKLIPQEKLFDADMGDKVFAEQVVIVNLIKILKEAIEELKTTPPSDLDRWFDDLKTKLTSTSTLIHDPKPETDHNDSKPNPNRNNSKHESLSKYLVHVMDIIGPVKDQLDRIKRSLESRPPAQNPRKASDAYEKFDAYLENSIIEMLRVLNTHIDFKSELEKQPVREDEELAKQAHDLLGYGVLFERGIAVSASQLQEIRASLPIYINALKELRAIPGVEMRENEVTNRITHHYNHVNRADIKPVLVDSLVAETQNLIRIRKDELQKEKQSRFYLIKTFFQNYLELGMSGDLKIKTEEKLLSLISAIKEERLEDAAKIEFTNRELGVLTDSRLGKIIQRYRDLNALPLQLQQQLNQYDRMNTNIISTPHPGRHW